MTNFNDLLHAELFQKGSKNNITNRVSALLEAFPHSKTILLEVEKYYVENIKDNTDYTKNLKERFYELLKKEWLYVWNKQDIKKEDLPIIERYFSSFNASSQHKLYEKIKTVSEDNNLILKPVKGKTPLTIALQNFRRGDNTELNHYLTSPESLSFKEVERISSTIGTLCASTDLKIYNEFIEKAIMSNQLVHLSNYHLEKIIYQEPKEVERVLRNYVKYEIYTELRSELVKEELKNDKIISGIIEKANSKEEIEKYIEKNHDNYPIYSFKRISTSNRIVFWNDIRKLFREINDNPSEKIINALNNIDIFLQYQKDEYIHFFKTYLKRDIQTASLESLFDLLEEKNASKKKTFRQINFSDSTIEINDFIEKYENVFKTYQMKKLTNSLEDKKPLQPKHKI